MLNSTTELELWPDEETWIEIFEPFKHDGEQLDLIARVLFYVVEQIEAKNYDGAVATLKSGLRFAFPLTDEFRLNYQHWLAFLGGKVQGENEPLRAVGAAMEHSRGYRR